MSRTTRRRFVQSAASLAAAPYIIPASAFGANDRIALAHIGVGGMGTGHLNHNVKHKDIRVVAVCDVDARHRERARGILHAAYGSDSGIDFVEDFRQLVDRKDIDAALIAVPDHWHALTTLAMLKSGKDVYCEKPLTRTILEGRKVADTAKRYGRVVQTGSHERSNKNARYVADVIRNGYLGDIKKVEVSMPVTNHGPVGKMSATPPPKELNYDLWLGPAPEKYYFEGKVASGLLAGRDVQRCHFWFRYQFDYATGEMSDRGAHILDLVQLALNKDHTGPIEFSGTGKRDSSGEFDSFMEYDFRYKYDDGVEVIGTSKGDDDSRGITYHGSEGWIYCHVHGCALKASDPKLLNIKLKPGEESVGGTGENAWEHHQNFYDAIRSRGDTAANAEIGHRSATVCHAATIATLVGKPLKWDPKQEKFTGAGADEANEHLGRKYREPWVL